MIVYDLYYLKKKTAPFLNTNTKTGNVFSAILVYLFRQAGHFKVQSVINTLHSPILEHCLSSPCVLPYVISTLLLSHYGQVCNYSLVTID